MLPARAFDWQTASARGREYVTLQSFCAFYNFGYASPSGNSVFDSRNPQGHTVRMKLGSPDLFLDGVHYVMSFPIEGGDRDWLVSRMDVIKLFEPVLQSHGDFAGRHSIRGIVIDAGHGGNDNGAQSRLGAEKNYTIDTAFRLESILRDAGLKTVLTRRNDVFVDLYERAHIASLYPDYAFVSIHYNSGLARRRAGLETYCCLAPARGGVDLVELSHAHRHPGADRQRQRCGQHPARLDGPFRNHQAQPGRPIDGPRREARAFRRDQAKPVAGHSR